MARLRGLRMEQQQLIAELQLIRQHVEELDAEMRQVMTHCRQGQILTSLPGIGPIAAATILALIGNIANFDRPSQLKASCGWAPTLSQSGVTLDHAKVTPRGARLLKRTLYRVVWQTLHYPHSEFARLYERLLQRKTGYDERTGQYRGRNKGIGRGAGQRITVIFTLLKFTLLKFTLLKRDQERTRNGGTLPEPERDNPEIHHRHRAGPSSAPMNSKLGTVVLLPPH
jgi:transposase